MRCEEIRKNMVKIIESTDEDITLNEYKKHIVTCPECSQFFVHYQTLWNQWDTVNIPSVSSDFYYKVQMKIERKSTLSFFLSEAIKHWQLVLNPLIVAILVFASVWLGVFLSTVPSSNRYTRYSEIQNSVPTEEEYFTLFTNFPEYTAAEFYLTVAQGSEEVQ